MPIQSAALELLIALAPGAAERLLHRLRTCLVRIELGTQGDGGTTEGWPRLPAILGFEPLLVATLRTNLFRIELPASEERRLEVLKPERQRRVLKQPWA